MPTSCVIIPCTPQHAAHLETCLASIRANTAPPSRVLVALSGTASVSEEEQQRLRGVLGSSCPLEFLCTEKTCFAAENRNRGARHCTEDVLIFMDADDEFLPHRMETVMDMMKRHRADAVLHSYKSNHTHHRYDCVQEIDPDAFAQMEKADREHLHLSGDLPVTHGHVVVTRHAYWKVGGQREGQEWRRGEDARFVRDLFAHKVRVAFTYRPLSVYHLHLSSERSS